MSFNQSYIRFEFTVGHITKEQELHIRDGLWELSSKLCPLLSKCRNLNEEANWSMNKARFDITYEEEHQDEIDQYLFKLRLQYPEFNEVQEHVLTWRH